MIMNISEKGKKECAKLLEKMKKTQVYRILCDAIALRPFNEISLFIPPNFILLDKVKLKMEEKYIYYSIEDFFSDLKAPFKIVSDFLLSDDCQQIKCLEYL